MAYVSKTSSPGETIKIIAQLNRCLYSSDKTDWRICLFKATDVGENKTPIRDTRGLSFKTVGNLAPFAIGNLYILEGVFEQTERYGEQFTLKQVMIQIKEDNLESIHAFLKSKLSAFEARELEKKYGNKVMEVLRDGTKEDHHLNPETARGIYREWAILLTHSQVANKLTEMQIPQTYHARIIEKWGEDSAKIISENYYNLMKVRGVGFIRADNIAQLNGIPINHPTRVCAAIEHAQELEELRGHTWSPFETLYYGTLQLTKVGPKKEDFPSSLAEFEKDGISRYYHPYLWEDEQDIIETLLQMAKPIENSHLSPPTREDLNEKQFLALLNATKFHVSILTGGPGTGKTYTIKNILSHYTYATLVAPTGKAAKRIEELTSHPATTIHSLLGVAGNLSSFIRGRENPLPGGVYVIDEASMVDTHLMASFLRALLPGSILIIVGDVDQLPSIGPGAVLQNLIDSGKIPTTHLTEIIRTSSTSLIAVNAQKILLGDSSFSLGEQFEWIFEENEDKIIQLVNSLIVEDPLAQILTPMHKTRVGTQTINESAQRLINPTGEAIKGTRLRVGDKVICTENDHQREIMNGDLGIIHSVSEEAKKIFVLFDADPEEIRTLPISYTENLQLAYCMSVHKSQGSEFDHVIFPIHASNKIMLQRNLIYTAITRAKKKCTLIGGQHLIHQAINKKMPLRRTGLLEGLL